MGHRDRGSTVEMSFVGWAGTVRHKGATNEHSPLSQV